MWPLLIACGWLALAPDPLFAWGPATHLGVGEMVLSSLYLVPPGIRALLERFPLHFLYGSIAADISFAKKYVPEGRHCHHWHVGEEILDAARTERMRAVALGYLAHLAADTVAHNLFVPRRLLLTSATEALGHAYWEHRMDAHVGEEFMRKARSVVMDHDHSEADALFDDVLSSTVFSFRTNRRIFRGMIRFQGHERWQRAFDAMLRASRFDLADDLVQRYQALSYDSVIDYFVHGSASRPASMDPIGEINLRLAKKIRRRAFAQGPEDEARALADTADEFFPFPERSLDFWIRYQTVERTEELPGPLDD